MDQTILHTPYLDKFLWFPPEQRPIVCQLGGSNPELLARAAKVVERYGYDEINLNCGGWLAAAQMRRRPRPRAVGDAAGAQAQGGHECGACVATANLRRRAPAAFPARQPGDMSGAAPVAPPCRAAAERAASPMRRCAPAGCPSDRVAGAGCFGAALMLQPELVAECCRAMCEAVSTPVTVKCRLGEWRGGWEGAGRGDELHAVAGKGAAQKQNVQACCTSERQVARSQLLARQLARLGSYILCLPCDPVCALQHALGAPAALLHLPCSLCWPSGPRLARQAGGAHLPCPPLPPPGS